MRIGLRGAGRGVHVLAGLLAAHALATAGCAPVVRAAEAQLERRLEQHGLAHGLADVAGARVEYWAGRTGDPVVLLHGFGPAAPWAWSQQIEPLAERFRVVAPNLLWFGASVDPQREFGLDRQVEVVAALLDALRVERAAVVGSSYGGLVAYRLAVVRPDLVGRLVMIDSPGAGFSQADYQALLERHGVDDAVTLFVPEEGEGVERLIRLAYWDEPPVPDPLDAAAAEVVYDPHRAEKRALVRTLVASIESWQGHPVPRQPSLVVWGEGDTVFPPATGRALARTLDAELVVFSEARHAPHIEHAERFNRLLIDWLCAGPEAAAPAGGQRRSATAMRFLARSSADSNSS